jgi:hypothetical protein
VAFLPISVEEHVDALKVGCEPFVMLRFKNLCHRFDLVVRLEASFIRVIGTPTVHHHISIIIVNIRN